MARSGLEVADIFRDHGPAWRDANRGHISLEQLKVMSAIERCRTAALGGHVARCENEACSYTLISYNSCRDRHCPKCQAAASREWLAEREAELLPVEYFHIVYTLPAPIADIAYQNKRVIYDLLFKAAAETTITIAEDPKHLGARIGLTAVLHTWGSAMTHHPHVHMIVPGGGLSKDQSRWVPCRPAFFLPVRVLSRLFRGLFLKKLIEAHDANQLKFFGNHANLAQDCVRRLPCAAEATQMGRLRQGAVRRTRAGAPLPGALHPSRRNFQPAGLVAADEGGVAFRWKDYRLDGPDRWKTMTLHPHEFIRRFLMHVLPKGFHRIRHYGLFANGNRAANIVRLRELLKVPVIEEVVEDASCHDQRQLPCPCPRCGGRMIIIEIFAAGMQPTSWPAPNPIRIDTS
jgi:Transposase zinc-binding domain/Putative transposase